MLAAAAVAVFAAIGAAGWLVLLKAAAKAPARTAGVDVYRAQLDSAPGGVAVAAPVQPPTRLVIARIGVNAPVVPVGLDKAGAMGVTSASYDTAWYKLGPAPGDAGDAVIDGHLDWYDTSRAVFHNLKDLRPGDDIEVQRQDGISRHFRVTGVQTVAYNATVSGLFATEGPPRLSLITCGGTWSTRLGEYLERVVVDSTLVS
jgi:LPXTG-site transpeptidase (sortase) family protein